MNIVSLGAAASFSCEHMGWDTSGSTGPDTGRGYSLAVACIGWGHFDVQNATDSLPREFAWSTSRLALSCFVVVFLVFVAADSPPSLENFSIHSVCTLMPFSRVLLYSYLFTFSSLRLRPLRSFHPKPFFGLDYRYYV